MARNRYIGSWQEPTSLRIDLPFTADALRQILRWGASPATAPCNHHDIASWCFRFWSEFVDVDAPAEIESVLPVVEDVDCQWDLHLANTYSLEQLQRLDFAVVVLPVDWFQDWLGKCIESN